MDITNKQQLANLMHHMDAANATAIALPQHNNARNSTGDNHRYSDTWYNEFWDLRESDPDNTICIDGSGVYLYGYRFVLDGHPVCYVSMEYDTVEPRGCALVCDDGINSPAALVYAWLGDTTLSEHTGEDIIDLARRAGIDAKEIDMAGYNELKAWMERQYGEATECTITCDGEDYTGYMYGNDECFDGDEFYQYFLTADALAKMYYTIPDGCDDYGEIDYSAPYDVRDADAQYWVDYVI